MRWRAEQQSDIGMDWALLASCELDVTTSGVAIRLNPGSAENQTAFHSTTPVRKAIVGLFDSCGKVKLDECKIQMMVTPTNPLRGEVVRIEDERRVGNESTNVSNEVRVCKVLKQSGLELVRTDFLVIEVVSGARRKLGVDKSK
jgi:hypothetical protein